MIEKVLSFLFFPPGGLVLLLLISIFLFQRKKKFAIAMLILSTLLLYSLSTKAVAELLIFPLENLYSQPKDIKADVIVVLGGGSFNYCPDGLCIGYSSIKRAAYALILQKETGLPVIVCGGKLFSSGPPEAETMAVFMERLGGRDIIVESSSINTWQQAIEVKKIMNGRGWKRAVLVTSAFHMARSVYAFKRHGIEVVPAPTDYRTDRSGAFISYLLPYGEYLVTSFLALHEYLGIVYYRLR